MAATALATAATLVVGGAGGAGAQLDLPPLLPTTTTTAPGSPPPPPPPPPTTTTTAPGSLIGNVLKSATTVPPTTAPPPTAAKPGAQPLPGNAGGEGQAPPPEAGPFPAHLAAMMNSVRRSRPNNSGALMDALKVLTDAGMSEEEAMRVGLGRFPVGGRSNFVHDWWFPRFGPGWRLHQGTDVFAPRGTPLRSPTTGTVSFSDGGLGGISVYITQADGTYFYMAHLDSRPAGLKAGQTVNTGDIVGYVGSTGNAAGGSPHLHFEVHPAIRFVTVGKGRKATTKAVSAPVRPGTVLPAIDPKPLLDLYLQEALAAIPAIAEQYRATRAATAPPVTGDAVPVDSAAIEVAARHLAVGGLIAAEAPLVRTPLLLLAFLLIVMVLVLFPVLAPRRRLALAGVPPGPAPAARGRRRRLRGRRAKAPPARPEGAAAGGTVRDGATELASASPAAAPSAAAPSTAATASAAAASTTPSAAAAPAVRFSGNVSANRAEAGAKGAGGRRAAKALRRKARRAKAPDEPRPPSERRRLRRRRRKDRADDKAAVPV
ncbi:MAG: M23 family metallopeptidase [Acidimicrobiia bacterium]